MIPNPIRKVLSTFRNCEVRALLMGGQACVFYGAAEFSRDIDFAILADAGNLQRLRQALDLLQATVVAVPTFEETHLQRGHAIHFRCHDPEADGLRVDIMSKMRGVDPFPALWERRTILQSADGAEYELLSLPDLVAAKKTQRDKDWPMIRRLIEAHYAAHENDVSESRLRFWFTESRTPEMLADLARRYPEICASVAVVRPLLRHAKDFELVAKGLASEEESERNADRSYWAPLRRELEDFRRRR